MSSQIALDRRSEQGVMGPGRVRQPGPAHADHHGQRERRALSRTDNNEPLIAVVHVSKRPWGPRSNIATASPEASIRVVIHQLSSRKVYARASTATLRREPFDKLLM